MPSPELEAERAKMAEMLRSLAESGGARDEALRAKIEASVRTLWEGCASVEWDRITALYHAAFGLAIDDPAPVEVDDFASLLADGSWFKRYLEYTSEGKAPPQFCFATAVALVAASFGQMPLIEWEACPLYPNLYVMLIGGSGSGKGAAIGYARKIVQPVLAPNVLACEMSPQGLVSALRERHKDTGTDADGILIAEEMKVLLPQGGGYKGEMAAWLTDLFSRYDRWDRKLRKDEEAVVNPCLSVLAANTFEWARQLPSDALEGGFLPRFLLFDLQEKDEMRYWGKAVPRFNHALGEMLKDELRVTAGRAALPATMAIDGEAERWLNGWYDRVLKRQFERADSKMRDWLNRKQAAMMKLATVMQIVDGAGKEGRLGVPWLHVAQRVVDYCDGCVGWVARGLGAESDGEILATVLRFFDRRGGEVEERALLRNSNPRNKYGVFKLRQALAALKSTGEIEEVKGDIRGVVWRRAK